MRLTTSVWASAVIRRAQAAGAFATIVRKGAMEAGAAFVVIHDLQGGFRLMGPAPQAMFEPGAGSERQFETLLEDVPQSDIDERLEKERRFDPDLWVIEIEDREGRSFLE